MKSDRAKALEILHKMCLHAAVASIGHKEIGYITRKLSSSDREVLKNLQSDDTRKTMVVWH